MTLTYEDVFMCADAIAEEFHVPQRVMQINDLLLEEENRRRVDDRLFRLMQELHYWDYPELPLEDSPLWEGMLAECRAILQEHEGGKLLQRIKLSRRQRKKMVPSDLRCQLQEDVPDAWL